ncbi:17447_t:CDS:2, partial [Entrophospora sp. SA101]
DQPIKSAEGIITYLTKYLVKSFQMRANKELAAKVGLLPNMRIYKFFQTTYVEQDFAPYFINELKTNQNTKSALIPKFEFKGPTAYTIFRDFIHPALRLLNLPNFKEVSKYQIRA